MSRRAVFLDRDGVLNQSIMRDGKPYPPQSLDEVVIPPDVRLALEELRAAGFLLIVLTNQPDIARGFVTRDRVDSIHRYLAAALPLDEFRVCDHDDNHQCGCRKPKPGLILTSAQDHGIDLAASFLVGDRWRDVDAGAAAGCRTVWIDLGYRERGPSTPPSATVHSFREAARWILDQAPVAACSAAVVTSYYTEEPLT
jgi:D-glycero-D-manno-heptose 1,7-bisphosphate phosphatase